MDTNKRLKSLMQKHPWLTRDTVKEVTHCRSRSTVDRWLAPSTTMGGSSNRTHRVMPVAKLDLLEREIEIRSKGLDNFRFV